MSAAAAGKLFLALAAIIILARVLGALCRRIGQPPVVGEILAGILIGPSLFGKQITDVLFPTSEVRPALSGLANAGLGLFMFIVGYELDHTLIRGKGRVAATVSIGSVVLPFAMGTTLALWLFQHHPHPHKLAFVLFVGAAMSVTAFPVLARILTDRGMQRIPLGSLSLASAAVDDIIAWSLLAVVVVIGTTTGGSESWHILLAVPYLAVMFLVIRPLLKRLVPLREKAGRLTPNLLAVVLVGLFLSAFTTEWLGVHFIFGAFLFGAVMPRTGGDTIRHEVMERLEQVSVLLLLPVYFVLSGIKVDLSTMNVTALGELGAILGVAIFGKFVGAYLGARVHRVPARRAGALAALMNTRGLTELVILTVGLQLGILDTPLFSMMVIMALITTGMTGPLLNVIYPKRFVDHDIQEVARAALGAADVRRVLAVSTGEEVDASTLAVATALAARHRPTEVVLSRLLPYQRRSVEVGTGLTGELMEMTSAMESLERLAGPARTDDLAVRVLTGFTSEPDRDFRAQVDTVDPVVFVAPASVDVAHDLAVETVTVRRPLPDAPEAVTVRLGTDDDAAVRAGALLAASRGVPLYLDGKASRRVSALTQFLTGVGIAVHAGDGGGVLVNGDDPHVSVRAERDTVPSEPGELLAGVAVPAVA